LAILAVLQMKTPPSLTQRIILGGAVSRHGTY
jgi:hypothetical protein